VREAFRILYRLSGNRTGGEILIESDRLGHVHVTLRSVIDGNVEGRPIHGFPGLACWIAPDLLPVSDDLFFRGVRIQKGSCDWLRFEQIAREEGARYIGFAAVND